eukprot:TRINITY_DN3337_c1_g1_i1.p1 TRINITY_DN3337_c1_g1~~TRINITY_DN3337_c1_g1_i1.p1  ORF type:complete len:333 (-),score=55.15 TRINITY_DN3337_c1_g1_i1:334-1332(-)
MSAMYVGGYEAQPRHSAVGLADAPATVTLLPGRRTKKSDGVTSRSGRRRNEAEVGARPNSSRRMLSSGNLSGSGLSGSDDDQRVVRRNSGPASSGGGGMSYGGRGHNGLMNQHGPGGSLGSYWQSEHERPNVAEVFGDFGALVNRRYSDSDMYPSPQHRGPRDHLSHLGEPPDDWSPGGTGIPRTEDWQAEVMDAVTRLQQGIAARAADAAQVAYDAQVAAMSSEENARCAEDVRRMVVTASDVSNRAVLNWRSDLGDRGRRSLLRLQQAASQALSELDTAARNARDIQDEKMWFAQVATSHAQQMGRSPLGPEGQQQPQQQQQQQPQQWNQ